MLLSSLVDVVQRTSVYFSVMYLCACAGVLLVLVSYYSYVFFFFLFSFGETLY